MHARRAGAVIPCVGFRLCIALLYFASALAIAGEPGDAAARLARAAAKADRKGDVARAYVLYSQAAALDPGNPAYDLHVQLLRSLATIDPNLQDKADAIRREPNPEAGLDESLFGVISAEDAAEARQPLPPTELKAAPGLQDFDLRGDSRLLFEQVARAYGLLVAFDTEYVPAASVRFQLHQVDYRTALIALQAATGSFVVPVADRLLFVASDVPAKRLEFEKTVAVAIPIPETTSNVELQEVFNAVHSAIDIQRITVDLEHRMILMRDRVSKVRPAQALLESLLRPHPQVDFEVDLVDVSQSDSTQWGAALPTSFPLADIGKIASYVAQTATPSGVSGFLTFGGGATLVGIGITQANLFANMTHSLTTTAYRAHLVASQGQPATLHVGSKYPQ